MRKKFKNDLRKRRISQKTKLWTRARAQELKMSDMNTRKNEEVESKLCEVVL